MMKSIIRKIDARDIFCLIGFTFLFFGVAHFDLYVAFIVLGAIVLLKGLTRFLD